MHRPGRVTSAELTENLHAAVKFVISRAEWRRNARPGRLVIQLLIHQRRPISFAL